MASSERIFTRQLSFQLPNKKSLQHKYAVVKPLKEATDLIIFLLKKHLKVQDTLIIHSFKVGGTQHPSHPRPKPFTGIKSLF